MHEAIQAYFLSSAGRRFGVCVAIALSLLVIYLAGFVTVQLNSVYGFWLSSKGDYKTWINGEGDKCARLLAEAKLEVTTPKSQVMVELERSIGRFGSDTSSTRQAPRDWFAQRGFDIGDLRERGDSTRRLLDGGCGADWDTGDVTTLTIRERHDPGSFPSYTMRMWSLVTRYPDASVLFIFPVLALALFLLTYLIRDFILETHLGWKRVTIVASIAAPVMVLVIFRDETDDLNLAGHIVYGLLMLVGTAAGIIYGRKIFHWVHTGFVPTTPQSSTMVSPGVLPVERAGEDKASSLRAGYAGTSETALPGRLSQAPNARSELNPDTLGPPPSGWMGHGTTAAAPTVDRVPSKGGERAISQGLRLRWVWLFVIILSVFVAAMAPSGRGALHAGVIMAAAVAAAGISIPFGGVLLLIARRIWKVSVSFGRAYTIYFVGVLVSQYLLYFFDRATGVSLLYPDGYQATFIALNLIAPPICWALFHAPDGKPVGIKRAAQALVILGPLGFLWGLLLAFSQPLKWVFLGP
jgi:hypothetical protein